MSAEFMDNFDVNENTDAALLHGLRTGKPSAWPELYDRYFRMIANYVAENNGSSTDAEDIFQETLFVFVKKVRQSEFALNSKIGTYLYAVARNLWLQRLEKERTRRNLPTPDEPTRTDDPETLEQRREREQHLDLVTSKWLELEEDCRRMLQLSFYEKRPQAEIATLMNYTEAFVKVKKHRCLDYLRRAVKNALKN